MKGLRSVVGVNSKEAILEAAKRTAMAHGYNGLNFRDLASQVGIRAPSLYYHFPSKADLGAAVAERYRNDVAEALDAIAASSTGPHEALRRYPEIFRASLASDNRMCLCSFMAAEYDDLPEPVRKEVQAFADVNVAWLSKQLVDASLSERPDAQTRARAVYAAVAGAQLFARGRSDIALFDAMIESFRASGLVPS